MSVNNENIVGAVNELLDLFEQQHEILDKTLDLIEINNISSNNERIESDKIEADFIFLSKYIVENISTEDSNRYIGKMLLNARQQANDIIEKAEKEADIIKLSPPTLDKTEPDSQEQAVDDIIEENQTETSFEPEIIETEVIVETEPGEVTELPNSQFEKTKEIHQKYKDSLDSILKEIDVFLDR